MGSCMSQKKRSDVYSSGAVNVAWKKSFDALNLTEWHVGQLYGIYEKMDQDHSGTISLWEMLEYLNLTRSKFTKRIFSIMDEDGSGEIDFREFVIAMWNYCTLGKASLILFAFDLYDNDNSGEIDFAEIELMLKEVYGKAAKTSVQAQSVYSRIAKMTGSHSGSETVSKEQFTEFVRTNPALLYPAFQLQTQLQKSVLGMSFWSSLSNSRVTLEKGTYMTVSAWLNVQLNQAAFDKLVQNDGTVDPETNQSFFKPVNSKLDSDSLYLKYEESDVTANAGTVAERRERQGLNTTAHVVTAAAKFKAKRAKRLREQEEAQAAEAAETRSQRAPVRNLKHHPRDKGVKIKQGQHQTAPHMSYGNYSAARGSSVIAHAKGSSAAVHPT